MSHHLTQAIRDCIAACNDCASECGNCHTGGRWNRGKKCCNAGWSRAKTP